MQNADNKLFKYGATWLSSRKFGVIFISITDYEIVITAFRF